MLFLHIFVMDGELIDTMRRNGLRTVLCVGNGLCTEPKVLAWAGLDVTVMDLSPFAMETAPALHPPDDIFQQMIQGRPGAEGGSLRFVVGDLLDPSCCPGPYDVIIERNTLQLFVRSDLASAVQAVADRLAGRGLFFSQAHNGPPSEDLPSVHWLEPWFSDHGWQISQSPGEFEGQVAWLYRTSG